MLSYFRFTSFRNAPSIFRQTPGPLRSNSTTSTTSTSVNPTEVSHFNALASTWWDPQGPSRILQQMNPHRHDFIRSCLKSQTPAAPTSGLRYLDVGCGGGVFTESAARLPHTSAVLGLDPSPEVLAVAEEHARQDPSLQSEGKLSYLNKTIEDLPLPKGPEEQYDIVTLFEVIEHISHPSPFLSSCLPFVKPGGWIVMSTIARTWTSWFTTKLVAEDIARIIPRGTHDWTQYINEDELREWFTKRGWTSPRATGLFYVPGLGWKEVSGGEKYGNYLFAARKQPGEQEFATR